MQTSQEEGTCDLLVEAGKEIDIREGVFRAMADLSTPILLMRPMDLSLEDIFLHLTTSEQEVNA